jgi:hypothetical protein
MKVLVDGGSWVLSGVDEVVELAGEGVGGWPAEVVGDLDDSCAASEADGPDSLGGSAVGGGVGVVDFDEDPGSVVAGPTGG